MQISRDGFNTLKAMVEQGNLSGFYQSLAGQGYQYAGLANEVLNASFPNGTAALAFMQQTAENAGRTLTRQDLANLKQDLAQGYLDALNQQIADQGFISRDINSTEAWAFHNDVYTQNNLPRDAWTLNTPFNAFGDNTTGREQFWQQGKQGTDHGFRRGKRGEARNSDRQRSS
jgi:hypothetical protein